MKIDLILNAGVLLAETPIWDERIQKLYWTDLFGGALHTMDVLDKTDATIAVGGLLGCAIPCETDGMLLVVKDTGLYLLNTATGAFTFVVDPEPGNEKNRLNDARCDEKGRVFVSSVSKLYGSEEYQTDMLGAFYMIDTDKTVTKLVDGIHQYNGIVFDKANENMYVVDTYNQTLLRFEYDLSKGPTAPPQVVIAFDAMPDGISIDLEDNLYVCHWNGTITVWKTTDFSLVKTIQMPVTNVCCGGFGGRDMKDFYIATSKFGQSEEHPEVKSGAGGIFCFKNEIAGRRDWYYQA